MREEWALWLETGPDIWTTDPHRALGFGLGLGVVYQTVLIPAQPHLEPRFVWVEVVVGVGLAFAVAEIAVRQRADRTPLRWQEYRLALLLGRPV